MLALRQSNVNRVANLAGTESCDAGHIFKDTTNGGIMDNKPRPKPNKGSTWNDENDQITNPNRRQDEDQDTNVESPRSGQRASDTDPGSSESPPYDKRDEQLHSDRQQTDPSRKQRQRQ